MEEVTLLIRRFPAHEFAVRRLYASDPEFKEVCEHYATATSALECWKTDEDKAAEWGEMIKELEDEVLEFLAATARAR
jgi:hypothetical protein